MNPKGTLRSNAGFTLVEILISTTLGLMVVAGFLSMATSQVTAAREQSTQIDLQQTVRDVAELFSREVRRAGSDATCSDSFDAIDFANLWGIRLKSDLDGDGSVNGPDENVLYLYSASKLTRSANNRTETLIDDVHWEGSHIKYFDGDGNELISGLVGLNSDQRAAVRRVRFVIDIYQNTSDGGRAHARAASDINLRNRFFVRSTGCPGAPA